MNGIKEALMEAMETYFSGDAKRISHAHRVMEYAEEIMKREGGDYPIITAAALLHDIGIHQAQKKYGSVAGKYQEIEGPPIARKILDGLGFVPSQSEEICEIIAHHHSPGKINTRNFKILYDADWLVNLRDEYNIQDEHRLNKIIEKVFLTRSGRALAREAYLNDKGIPYNLT